MYLNSPMRFASQDNAPLDAVNSNYPCKLGKSSDPNTVYAYTQRSNMALGSDQVLQLMGQAVHGGGSCQLSLTKDLQPTSQSVFKVIHSIEGGCPARNTAGNLGDSSTTIDPFTYNYTIPADLEAGDYVFSWTWFNKIGNREMYMSCAPVTLTGGSSSKRSIEERGSSAFDALPNLIVGNVPDSPCTTSESTNILFDNPGMSVEINNETAYPFKDFVVKAGLDISQCYAPFGGAKPAVPASGSSSVLLSSVSSATSSALAVVSSSKVSSVVSSAGPSAVVASLVLSIVPLPSTVFASPAAGATTTSAAAGQASSSGSIPVPSLSHISPASSTTAVISQAVTKPIPSLASSNSGACPAGHQSCTTLGAIICIGTSQFGICDTNMCAVPQLLAAGTHCTAGVITKRDEQKARIWFG